MTDTQPETLRIATRKSALALWQAHYVRDQLLRHHPQLRVELVPMSSRGDTILDVPLAKVGGKGLFVKELEHALLQGSADIAVHSMKDVPMQFPAGLGLSTICPREDPRDALVSNLFDSLEQLPAGSVVGTSSLRRQCQLLARRPDLQVSFLRGNVNTRLQKLDDGEFDAIILACAGLMRLDMSDRIRQRIAPEILLPAGGQGAVGIETRSDDARVRSYLEPLHCPRTAQQVIAERAMNRCLEGGCQVPIGCYALHEGEDRLWLRGLVGSPDGTELLCADIRGSTEAAEQLGIELAQQLLNKGAARILRAVYGDDRGGF